MGTEISSKETAAIPTPATRPKLTVNPHEAAPMLGVGHHQVRQLVRSGKLPTLPGRNVNIPIVAIHRYLEQLGGEK